MGEHSCVWSLSAIDCDQHRVAVALREARPTVFLRSIPFHGHPMQAIKFSNKAYFEKPVIYYALAGQ